MEESHEKLLGYWMHRIGFAFRSRVDNAVQELGIRGPDAMIMIRISWEGTSTLVELSKMIGHAHTSILRHIDKLEKKGYLKREPHENDRRIKVVSLTPKGNDIIPQIKAIINTIHRQALKDFTAEESDRMFQLLRKIDNNLTNLDIDQKEFTEK